MDQTHIELTDQQIRIIAYLMLYGSVEQAAEEMGVDPSYITSHFVDTHFTCHCIDLLTTANVEARSKGYKNFYDYAKADIAARKDAQAFMDKTKMLSKNFMANIVGPEVRDTLYRRDYLQVVCLQGYEVCNGIEYNAPSKKKCIIVGWKPIRDKYYLRGRDYRFYNPIRETPGLHRIISDLEPTPDTIKAFCNQYGALWEPWDIFSTPRGLDVCLNDVIPHGYSFDDYLKEIHELQQAILIFDILSTDDPAIIRNFCQKPTSLGYKDNSIRLADDCRKISPGYLYAHLNEILCIHISHGLRRNEVLPELIISKYASEGHFSKEIYEASFDSQEPYEPVPEWGRVSRSDHYLSQPNGMELVYRPQNLAGILWLMFAYEITGVKTYKQCPTCGSWFEISELNDNRISRVYCDDNCRARAYRKRISGKVS